MSDRYVLLSVEPTTVNTLYNMHVAADIEPIQLESRKRYMNESTTPNIWCEGGGEVGGGRNQGIYFLTPSTHLRVK